MNTKQSKICTCGTCGYKWESGQDGYHVCASELLKTVQNLKAAKTFAFGDQVVFVENRPIDSSKLIPTGDYLTITEIAVCEGYIEYAVNNSAWYGRDDLELVARADEKSLAFAFALYKDEDEEYIEDEEFEDDEDILSIRTKSRGSILDGDGDGE